MRANLGNPMSVDYQRAASQCLRAIRGKRSQVAFARRLGYRGNPITDWENGRRFPTAAETLRACGRARIDVDSAFARFHTAARFAPDDLHGWLEQLRGGRPVTALARRMGRSRFSVARWLSGAARPRLPEFLQLVDVMTGRAPELVAELVDIEQVPELAPRVYAARAAVSLAMDEPWSEAILRALETAPPGSPTDAGAIARRLRIDIQPVDRALGRLLEAGIVEARDGRLEVVGELNVDTKTQARLQRHWSGVVAARTQSLGEGETFGYNVMSLAERDLPEVREILRRAYRDIRSLVATSEPRDSVSLVALAIVRFDDPETS